MTSPFFEDQDNVQKTTMHVKFVLQGNRSDTLVDAVWTNAARIRCSCELSYEAGQSLNGCPLTPPVSFDSFDSSCGTMKFPKARLRG
jgi:hypothetical protein